LAQKEKSRRKTKKDTFNIGFHPKNMLNKEGSIEYSSDTSSKSFMEKYNSAQGKCNADYE
jgi:hypothetical protein